MIRIQNLCKTHHISGRHRIVARNIHATFPTGVAVGLLGRNGAGKSSLLQMIAGTMRPDRGQILSSGRISWPVGFSGSFHPDLTGVQNMRFLARSYGVDTDDLLSFVEDFAGIGSYLALPVRSYSSGMRARLAFAASMGIPFDTYLIDEVTAVGDAQFRRKCERILQERMRQSGAIIVSHSLDLLARLCSAGAVLEEGRLEYYPRIQTAIARHQLAMLGPDTAEDQASRS